MKLYLSSHRIPNIESFSDFVGKSPHEIKMGLVLNAKDDRSLEYRTEKRDELFKYFSDFGFKIEEIDLRDYANNPKDLSDKLKNFDVVWFNGGNIYSLKEAIDKSKSKDIIRDVFNIDVIYAGDSAGSIIVGPTLKHFDKVDTPNSPGQGTTYEGLHFIDFVIIPHWNSEKFGEISKTIKKELEEEGYKTIELKDDEFLLVDNEKVIKNG
jgi:dipeptidase E